MSRPAGSLCSRNLPSICPVWHVCTHSRESTKQQRQNLSHFGAILKWHPQTFDLPPPFCRNWVLIYSAYMVIVFFTLVMYYGKRVHFHEVPFGYDEIQQNCHWFCFKLFLKKCILIFQKSLSEYLPRRPFCVSVSKLRGAIERPAAGKKGWRSRWSSSTASLETWSWFFDMFGIILTLTECAMI